MSIMRRIVTLAFLATASVALSAAPAAAQSTAAGGGHGLGLGITQMSHSGLPFLGGLQIAYDPGAWHLEGLFGITDPGGSNDNDIRVGARFWYHLHAMSAADFSIGGGVGYRKLGTDNENNDDLVEVEAGAHIRAFITSNVAVSASAGLLIATADYDGFALGGNLLGGLGLTYYFR